MAGRNKSPSESKSKIKKPLPFDWTDSLQKAVEKRAYGHAKAGALIARITYPMQNKALQFIKHLDNLGFYGNDIWWGFEVFCKSDVEYFKAVVELEDKEFFNAVMDFKAKEALKVLRKE